MAFSSPFLSFPPLASADPAYTLSYSSPSPVAQYISYVLIAFSVIPSFSSPSICIFFHHRAFFLVTFFEIIRFSNWASAKGIGAAGIYRSISGTGWCRCSCLLSRWSSSISKRCHPQNASASMTALTIRIGTFCCVPSCYARCLPTHHSLSPGSLFAIFPSTSL